jgi:hypothetical protein
MSIEVLQMSMIGSFTRSIGLTFDTASQGMVALNSIMKSAAHRARVVEDKSINAACTSSLKNRYDVARTVQNIYAETADISEEALAEGDAVIAQFRSEIGAGIPDAITKVTGALSERIAEEAASRIKKGKNKDKSKD